MGTAASGNIFTYLASEYATFDELPLGDVDSLVLACLSYLRLPSEAAALASSHGGIVVRELWRAEWTCGMARDLWDAEGLVRLLGAVAASPRFRDILVTDYADEFDEASEKQFAACTLRLPSGDAYVSFRGTDNSLVGWKEDFNMAFETPVPSQRRAVSYLEAVAGSVAGGIYVGGHSKGGNLAVYAASMCGPAARSRLVSAFSHDGPGFTEETLSSPEWAASKGLVRKTVPKSSPIGMIFESQEDLRLVESTSVGIMQHDPFSWVVDGRDFSYVSDRSLGAGYLDAGLSRWLAGMGRDERRAVVNALFSMVSASGEESFVDLGSNWQTSVPAMLAEAMRLDGDQREALGRAAASLVKAFAPSLPVLGVPGAREADADSTEA